MFGRFPVKVNGRWREAEISFATERDVKRLAYWRVPMPLPQDPIQAQRIYDAVEFARLACNRWRYYHRQGATATSVDDLRRVIREHPHVEVAVVLIARPVWRSPIPTLGIAYLRRTWCHHLFLEFFAAHPKVIVRRHEQIALVGTGFLQQLVALAEMLRVSCIWGEATEFSAGWYEDQLGVEKVLDHFFIEDEVMKLCCDEMHKSQEQMLARRLET